MSAIGKLTQLKQLTVKVGDQHGDKVGSEAPTGDACIDDMQATLNSTHTCRRCCKINHGTSAVLTFVFQVATLYAHMHTRTTVSTPAVPRSQALHGAGFRVWAAP